ncbi:2-oxo acid dehydrogenase subunit E2 [Hamadaea tsunoensis]|uniref:2-oxo acid dehydrogenase subunit E2 n=1 Tax=Hamadaea tsunoensis TaxID=53368 RepID=UPI00040382F7|nr:2-oxo acid dehydrogenase subunit E2 [Hamadaea tsunoensis]
MAEIRVPKLNANDSAYVLVDWLVKDGEPVRAGAGLAEVETSKAVEEIPAPQDGYVAHAVAAGAEVEPGQVIARVSASPAGAAVPGVPVPDRSPAEDQAGGGQLITAPARARMAELGVTEEQVLALPVKLVRSADIETLAGSPSAASPSSVRADPVEGEPLSRVQRAVGWAVSTSHTTIPAAYTVSKIDMGAAQERARRLIRQVRRPVTIANLFIEAVAALHGRFPAFYSRLTADGSAVIPAEAPHIGVTVDVGTGLFVPVLRNAARLSTEEIATRLADLRTRAAEGAFRPAELEGANIGVTLHTEADVVLAIPFIFPGQVCALALTTPQAELYLTDDGDVARRWVAYVGLAYDHRVINGREAAQYLDALRAILA